jgi:hypothetical protein
MEEQQRRHDEAMKAQYLQSLMAGQPYERRVAIARQYGLQAPDYVPNEQEQTAAYTAQRQRQTLEGFNPDQFQTDYIGTELLTGRNPNAQYTEAIHNEKKMTPEAFKEWLDIRAGRKMSAEQDDKSKLGWSELRTVKQPVAQSMVRENDASAYASRQTGNLRGEEIVTEQQKRDPNSGYTQSQTTTIKGHEAKAKTEAEAKPMQLKAANFHGRMVQALNEIQKPREGGLGIEDALIGRSTERNVVDNAMPNMLNVFRTEEMQGYRAAQRAFTEARLRKESGAAIPPHEYETDAQMYFFQPGDTPKTLEQKRRARQMVVDGVAAEAGRALTNPAASVVSAPDGSQWRKNPDGSMTRVK